MFVVQVSHLKENSPQTLHQWENVKHRLLIIFLSGSSNLMQLLGCLGKARLPKYNECAKENAGFLKGEKHQTLRFRKEGGTSSQWQRSDKST